MTPARFSKRVRILAGAAAVLWAAAALVGGRVLWVWRLQGVELQARAWKASFEERGKPYPLHGPREGLWGSRLAPKVPDPRWGWREAAVDRSPWVAIDRDGWQAAGPADAPRRLVVVGGSVAFGAYASSEEATWFARLARGLADRRFPVRVIVAASGSWTSLNEEKVVQGAAKALRPDVLLVLDGLNDLTQAPPGVPGEERVAGYLSRMRSIRDWAAANHVGLCFVLQPFLPQKRWKTLLERRILQAYPDRTLYAALYPRMREGLRALSAEKGGALFVDASGVFDGETSTTFSDLWHFSDPGHERLARVLADALEPWWRGLEGMKP